MFWIILIVGVAGLLVGFVLGAIATVSAANEASGPMF